MEKSSNKSTRKPGTPLEDPSPTEPSGEWLSPYGPLPFPVLAVLALEGVWGPCVTIAGSELAAWDEAVLHRISGEGCQH